MQAFRSNAMWYSTAVGVVTAAFLTVGGFMILTLGNQGSVEASTRPNYTSSQDGKITGRVYDEQGVTSSSLQVCAQPTLGGTPLCVKAAASGTYRLIVPAGQYLVYSYHVLEPMRLAYYTKAVDCTGSSCASASHSRVVVNVTAGGLADGILPVDWPATQ